MAYLGLVYSYILSEKKSKAQNALDSLSASFPESRVLGQAKAALDKLN